MFDAAVAPRCMPISPSGCSGTCAADGATMIGYFIFVPRTRSKDRRVFGSIGLARHEIDPVERLPIAAQRELGAVAVRGVVVGRLAARWRTSPARSRTTTIISSSPGSRLCSLSGRGSVCAARPDARAAIPPELRPASRSLCAATCSAANARSSSLPTDATVDGRLLEARLIGPRTLTILAGGTPCTFSKRAVEHLQIRLAAHAHVARQLGLQHLDDALHAVGAVGRQPPHDGPSHEHALRAEGERLENVGAAPEAAVHQHRRLAIHGVDDRRQRQDRRLGPRPRQARRSSTRSIPSHAVLQRELCGLRRGDALHDHRHARRPA